MHIPLPWAIALTTAGAMLVVTLLGLGVRAGRIRAPERALFHVAYLLGGGVTGFLALAFPPAWPFLAFIAGVLGLKSLRERRLTDFGLMLCGFGAAWTLLLGASMINDISDPAVHGSPGVLTWFLAGSGVLVAGVLVLIRHAARPSGRTC
ncbi:MAG TPA: hypothetical protein VHK28_08125 [Candidatus Limnocylindria bacterium]|nr:hypothetical protein [Candidatus Limnocylindria bacterium]